MPRRVPFSHKKKRAQILDARAVKRGELDASDTAIVKQGAVIKARASRQSRSGGPVQLGAGTDTRKLQSKFIGLSADYPTRTRDLAFADVLERPLPSASALFPLHLLTDRDKDGRLSVPARPKFRWGQTKKEVERNEEGMFRKWLKNTQEIVEDWVDAEDDDVVEPEAGEEEEFDQDDEKLVWPRGPSWFETNLEVWRQLWRVTEVSHVLLLLLDSRCPPLHCPPSLRTHLQSLRPRKEVILILTKADLVDPVALHGWKEWVKGWWGEDGIQVVSVMSYDLHLLYEGKGRHRPDIPRQSLDELISALQAAHRRLLTPPQWAKDDPEKAKEWQAPVRRTVDWSALHEEDDDLTLIETPHTNASQVEGLEQHEQDQADDTTPVRQAGTGPSRDPQFEPLTIGLIGQPNVGKSSLLNALLGEQKVRASRTPGKTKHFQTMFWGPKKEVKIVDCPGLVCPSLVGLELQALAGTCIHLAAQHLPLETIFRVPLPVVEEPAYVGRKTYRTAEAAERAAKEEEEQKQVRWTAGNIIDGRAVDRGFLTAKSGRPDTNRSANGMMRALADGKIRWGFYPSNVDITGREGVGIWLGSDPAILQADEGYTDLDEGGGSDDEPATEGMPEEHPGIAEEHDEEEESGEEDGDEDEEEEEGGEAKGVRRTGGFFAALELSSGEDDDADDDEASDGEEE